MPEPSRADHLAWCKKRALEYVDQDDLGNAVASMMSDLSKHPGTSGTPTALILMGVLEIKRGPGAVRHWIEGFN